MAKTPEMSTDFARWYHDAFMDEGATRDRRWKAVVDAATNPDDFKIEILTRYAFATVAPSDGGKVESLVKAHEGLIKTLSSGGAQLDPKSSTRELQILCAAVLERLFSSVPDAAIAVLNASFEGLRTADLPMNLPALAKKALGDLSRKQHARPDEEQFESIVPDLDFEVSAEAMANMTAAQWKPELERLRDAAQEMASEIVEGQNRVANLLVRQISLAEEELQMLWWLIGAYSNIVDLPFKKIKPAFRPLAMGKELGQLTHVSPGPASLKALLIKAGLDDKAVKITEAVTSADLGWIAESTKSSRISPVTTPIHFALEKRLEIDSADAWIPVWAAMTSLPADASMSSLQLAELFYREHLFLHVVG